MPPHNASVPDYSPNCPLLDYPQTTVDKSVPQLLKSLLVYLIVCLSVGKYFHISPHPPLSPLVWNSKKFAVLNKKLSFPE